jgi:ABC-2 type transport system ATP-binding protein
MSKYVVEVHDVKKSFFLPHHKNNSLKTAITQIFKPKKKGGETFNALNGVSFKVEKGDFFGILGRNGSGKSTLLKIISEIYQPTSGYVKHDGKIVSFIELGVGFKPELSGRENVFLNGALLGFSKEEVAAMYDDIVAFAELEEFMDQKLKNYSSGMKVRLAFSVAIRAKADILILDEVLAVGDAAFQRKCTSYFETLKEDGKTVILVTHSMGNVRQFCNKAVVVESGKVIYEGDANGAADEYMKLFSKVSDSTVKENNKWGDGSASIKSFAADITPEKITIDIKVKAHQAIKEALLGVRISDLSGRLIAGMSTYGMCNKTYLSFIEDEEKHITFEIDNMLGVKSVDIGASLMLSDRITTCISWDKAIRLNNPRNESYYPVVFDKKVIIR